MLFAAGDPVNNSDPCGLFTVVGAMGVSGLITSLRTIHTSVSMNVLSIVQQAYEANERGDDPLQAMSKALEDDLKYEALSLIPGLGELYYAFSEFARYEYELLAALISPRAAELTAEEDGLIDSSAGGSDNSNVAMRAGGSGTGTCSGGNSTRGCYFLCAFTLR
jgi:hypothetical protein